MNQTMEFCMCPMGALGQARVECSPPGANTGQGTGVALPLAFLGTGASGRITALRGPSDMVRHITELGFVEGAEIKVVSGILGNLIIELKGSRLAVGRQMAAHIIVTTL